MTPDRYAVVGNPIGHSLSPRIHALFAEQTGQHLVYEARLGRPEHFAEDVREWFREGLRGLNVTVPFKEEAFRLVDQHSRRAGRAGAVNTIWIEADGLLTGDNTDGAGFLRDLTQRLGFDPGGRAILILGAGGATRGLLEPLLGAAPARLVIANRTPEKARGLQQDFADLARGARLEASGLEDMPAGPYDLVINATAAGLGSGGLALPPALLGASGIAYDLVYGPAARRFLEWAGAQGAATVTDGLGMLVEQAAEAFAIWRGVRPETAPVLAAIRDTAGIG
ncbi:shikimate dehydrogenase [Thioalkalivibrio sp.]|uniref:shikimate dehydrogenase n=1 Tax=Thioalkalivibrio sp. TaxID=2093813 RepID=UPI0039763283